MKEKSIGALLCLLLFSAAGLAQSTSDTLYLSLVEAVNLAVTQNPQLRSTQLDETKNEFKIKEITSSALPQLSGDASFTDNFKRPTQILPGEILGQPGTMVPVQFGTRFQMGATAQLSQTIYNPSLNIGIKAAKASQGLYKLQTFKSKEELIYNVINLYVQLQMIERQEDLLVGNLQRMKKLVEITNLQFKEGIIKKVDVDQLKVNQTNLETQLSNTRNNYRQVVNNLKTLMNVEVEQPVAVTEVGIDRVPVARQLFLESNTNLRLLDYQMQLQELNTKNIRAGYLPTVSLFANYGWNGQSNKLLKNGETRGFTSGLYGVKVNIPIFDGFARRHRITQSNIELKQIELNKQYLTRSIKNQFQTAANNLSQNERVLQAQQENMRVAEELYDVAKLSYTEGIAPLSELINAENGLKEAQTQYLTAMLQMNLAELDLMQTSGQLSQIINSASSTSNP